MFLKKFVVMFFSFAIVPCLSAHPHMFVTCIVEPVIEAGELKGFFQDWYFDAFFTGSIIQDYDLNGDLIFDLQETQDVKDFAFSNLQYYDYFTYITVGSDRTAVTEVLDFSVRIENNILVYRFFVPFEKDISVFDDQVSFMVFDKTYFTAISYGDEPVTYNGEPFLSWEVKQNRENPYYYDPLSPPGETIDTSKWQEGYLETFPDEIHFSLR